MDYKFYVSQTIGHKQFVSKMLTFKYKNSPKRKVRGFVFLLPKEFIQDIYLCIFVPNFMRIGLQNNVTLSVLYMTDFEWTLNMCCRVQDRSFHVQSAKVIKA